jgi:surface polysaccharide O-acyltransferase-like enzyme
LIETFVPIEGTSGWNRYAYVPFLVYGYLIASDPRFEQSMLRHRELALVGGVFAVLAFFAMAVITWKAGVSPTHGYEWESVLWRMFKGCSSWFWIVAILGWARWFKKGQPRRKQQGDLPGGHTAASTPLRRASGLIENAGRYLGEAVLPFYIIHQTVLIIIGFYVVRWDTAIMVKYLAICLATFVVTLILYDLIRRTNPTRFLFGMKLLK